MPKVDVAEAGVDIERREDCAGDLTCCAENGWPWGCLKDEFLAVSDEAGAMRRRAENVQLEFWSMPGRDNPQPPGASTRKHGVSETIKR